MKNGLLTFTATMMLCASAMAQSAKIVRIDETLKPQTTLYVDVTIEKQDVVAGPYSRYAQKYLGITAPLSDKVLYEIQYVKLYDVSTIQQDNYSSTSTVASHINPERGFPKLLVDRSYGSSQNLEENARLAAGKIFEIRESRYELITGEAGENVFGAGLKSAIEELNRLEEEYISLFLGKQILTTTTRHYEVIPSGNTLNYIVCRFTEADGLLPKDDLSGMPVVLNLKPLENSSGESGVGTEALAAGITSKPGSKSVAYRIAADVECSVIFESTEFASTVIPILQLGQTVYATPQ